MHLIRLGSLHLPDYLDFDALDSAQAKLIEAVRRNDASLAQEALAGIRAMRIPLDPA